MQDSRLGKLHGYVTAWDKYISHTPCIKINVPTRLQFKPWLSPLDPFRGWEPIEWPKYDDLNWFPIIHLKSPLVKSKLSIALKDLLPTTFYGLMVPSIMTDTLNYLPTLIIASFYRLDKQVPRWWGFDKDRASSIDSLMEAYVKSNHLDKWLLYSIEYSVRRGVPRDTYFIR